MQCFKARSCFSLLGLGDGSSSCALSDSRYRCRVANVVVHGSLTRGELEHDEQVELVFEANGRGTNSSTNVESRPKFSKSSCILVFPFCNQYYICKYSSNLENNDDPIGRYEQITPSSWLRRGSWIRAGSAKGPLDVGLGKGEGGRGRGRQNRSAPWDANSCIFDLYYETNPSLTYGACFTQSHDFVTLSSSPEGNLPLVCSLSMYPTTHYRSPHNVPVCYRGISLMSTRPCSDPTPSSSKPPRRQT
eukprot:758377-Hanusia_phi.AAC.6